MKLQVGKSYVNRAGIVKKIVDQDCDDDYTYPFTDSDGETYKLDGTYNRIYPRHAMDLIAEAPEVVSPTEAAETCQFMPATDTDTQPNDGGPASAKSLREWYAAHASDADIANHRVWETRLSGIRTKSSPTREEAKFLYADAMIRASKK